MNGYKPLFRFLFALGLFVVVATATVIACSVAHDSAGAVASAVDGAALLYVLVYGVFPAWRDLP